MDNNKDNICVQMLKILLYNITFESQTEADDYFVSVFCIKQSKQP